ncbi:glycosyltransferase family 2 protein [Pseudomonas sediminis]|uniref:glycosyltransferase family 2 protein n=1 Tax=Pseudomonas sp. Marseille-Q0931 TaxID=2697507 RepID=UPI0023B9445B|nr:MULTISPECIES: glycosyltransferase family 2 protein [Pseudomonas]MDG9756908.1 glycosyltransferase family 2 protein [Pseudomonas sediminis]MDH1279698.1 glycosyltransferase family 2 protein [Pseudomonas chengduensis]
MSVSERPGAPLVSVIVPCYNYASYVGDALRSILEQDYQSIELIVIDDGSTDDSARCIEDALRDWRSYPGVRRVEFIRQSNQGVSAALNKGLELAQGEFVATFDADDVMVPGRIALQAHYLMDHPEVGCLGGRAQRIDQHGAILPKKNKAREVRSYDFSQALAQALVVGGNLVMYRRDAMLAAGMYDPSLRVQDFQMTLKIAHAGYRIDVIPDTVTLYRKHEGGLSRNYLAEYRYGMQLLDLFRDHPAYESGKARLLTKILGPAVTQDKRFAWRLFAQIPLRQWDRQLFKRFRHLLLKPRARQAC